MTDEQKRALEVLENVCTDDCVNKAFVVEPIKHLIQTQQEGIEKYKYLYQKALDNTIKADRDNLKKDKIIDEMAKYIEDESTVDEFCSKENCYADDYENGHCRKCLNCIKKYFINKVEKENKDDN